jgi:hypothetical protein
VGGSTSLSRLRTSWKRAKGFYTYLEGKVEVSRIRHGSRQTLEILMNEEALLLAKYLRDERDSWSPKITVILKW